MAAPGPAGGTRRFYAAATTEAAEGGFALLLDGRRARTPARAPFVLPTAPLAAAVAAEWAAQAETIVPATMPLTRIANTAIDGVAPRIDAVRDEITRYAGSDLVLYRAGEPERLVALQAEAWDPVLDWGRAALGARFILSQGVTHVAQPEAALSRIRSAIEAEASPFRVAALHVATTLTGSALMAAMLAAGRIDPAEAWRAAHVDELFQDSRWGADHEATLRRDAREAEFRSAAEVLALVPA